MASKNNGVSLQQIKREEERMGKKEVEKVRFYVKSHCDNGLEMYRMGGQYCDHEAVAILQRKRKYFVPKFGQLKSSGMVRGARSMEMRTAKEVESR